MSRFRTFFRHSGRSSVSFVSSGVLALTALIAALTLLPGCASDTSKTSASESTEDESWRTASQRQMTRRPTPADLEKQAKAAKAAEAAKAAQEGRDVETGELEEPLRLDPDGPKDRETYVRWDQDLGQLTKLEDPQPQYTEEARKARIQGVVRLDLWIDEEGIVQGADVIKELPMGLTEQAIKAGKSWRYEPIEFNGEPLRVIQRVTMNFRLQ